MRIQELGEYHEELMKGVKQKHNPYQNTVVRQPRDYDTHPKYEKREPSMYKFSDSYIRMQDITLEEYEDQTNLKTKSKSQAELIINIDDSEDDSNGHSKRKNGKKKKTGVDESLLDTVID